MGGEVSKPKLGATVKVIGAGLPRTGTTSFAQALAILLDGPTYHSGTQMLVSSDETHIKTQIKILERTPIKTPEDKAFVLDNLRKLTAGYVATADSSMCQFVPELMELYPEALVICTVRDPESWARSMGDLAGASLQGFLAFMLFLVPSMRYFPKWVRVLHEGRWGELYIRPGEKADYGKLTWERHLAWLRENVPSDRLVFYSVKDGWEPLCKALNVAVPKQPFPKSNDSAAMDEFGKKQIARGLKRWAIVAAISSAAIVGARRFIFASA